MNKKFYLSKLKKQDYQVLLPQVENKLLAPLNVCQKFNFVKTKMIFGKQFNTPNYHYTKLYSSKISPIIGCLARDLISKYKDDPRYDNSIAINNDTLKHSREYILYLVWN